ncbi:hypothetical protein AIJ32_17240, partial [Salmonella enterica]|nr:hypothetical protein [Salmonella enterica]
MFWDISMMKKILITAIGFSIVGCAGMKLPDYTQVKSSPYYAECREFAMGVYKNDGYSKLGNTVSGQREYQARQGLLFLYPGSKS